MEYVAGDWRHGVDPAQVAEKLAADREHRVKAVCVVHNETSTGVTTRIPEIRAAIDQAKHPALFMVDTISSLASIDYRHDEWGVDVTVAGSQKGLMLPPGLGFNAVSDKALAASKSAKLTRSYWDWQAMQETGKTGFFPYTPATNLLYGLREALKMLLDEEGLEAVFARHARYGEATRRAVAGISRRGRRGIICKSLGYCDEPGTDRSGGGSTRHGAAGSANLRTAGNGPPAIGGGFLRDSGLCLAPARRKCRRIQSRALA